MWLPYILDTRKTTCQRCKEKTTQELRVECLKYIYAENWVCLQCVKNPRGIPVVERGEVRFIADDETVKEIAQKKAKEKIDREDT